MALVLCLSCRRHVHAGDRVCPFCSVLRVVVVGAALVACHGSPAPSDAGAAADGVDASAVRVPAAVYGGPPPRPSATVPAPPPDAGPLDVDGAPLTPHAASLAKAQQQYKHCFNLGLKRDPNMYGKLVVSINVGADGKSVSATITQNTGLSAEVAACVAAAAGAREFSAPAGGSATVEMPVNFAAAQ